MAKKEKNDKEKKANNFFKELKLELKKVTWPTFKGLVNNTSAVIAIVLIVAIIVFVLDVCFENLNDLSVGRIKNLVSSDTEETIDVETTDETESEQTGDVEIISADEEIPAEQIETETEVDETSVNSEQ